jgi:hypothetical protein
VLPSSPVGNSKTDPDFEQLNQDKKVISEDISEIQATPTQASLHSWCSDFLTKL